MKSLAVLAAAAFALVGTFAVAEERYYPSERLPPSKIGFTAEAGGGIGGFLDSRAAGQTTNAGTWTARLQIGSRSHIAGEAAYQGSAQNLRGLGSGSGLYAARLIGNGVEGNLRLNLLTGVWQPYAVGGLGWMHYNTINTGALVSDFGMINNVIEFPVGAGMAWRFTPFVIDARMAFHPSAGSSLATGMNMSTWDLAARLGGEF